MQKWEYMSLLFWNSNCYLTDNLEEKQIKLPRNVTATMFINNLGRQGWEMINFQIVPSLEHHYFYFRRPIE